MTRSVSSQNRRKILVVSVLGVLLTASVLLIVAGVNGVRTFNANGFSRSDTWSVALRLEEEASTLYRDTIVPALARSPQDTSSQMGRIARDLLAKEWKQEASGLDAISDEQAWKLLSMTYSYSRKKLTSAQGKAIRAMDASALQDHLLKALCSDAEIGDDEMLSGIPSIKNRKPELLMQIFLASSSRESTVLNKNTSLDFTRAVEDESRYPEILLHTVDGTISPVSAWIMEHARSVILTGVLLTLDFILLFFLLRHRQSWKMDSWYLLILLIVDFLLVFQLLPLIYLVIKSFFPSGSFSLDTFVRLYTYPMNRRALANTLIASTCTMVLGTLIAFPLAWLVGRSNLYGRRFFRSLFVLPYTVPPYVGAMAWLRLLNKNVGTLNLVIRSLFHLNLTEGPLNIYSLAGLTWVLTTFYFPYAFITISRAMEKMDPTLEEASRISGASPLTTVVRITLPIMTPSLIAGALLVFVCAASCYGIPSIIGEPGRIYTVSTRIIEYYGLGVRGINDATGMAVFLICLALAVLYISDFVVAKRQYITVSGKSTNPAIVDLRKARLPLTLLVSLFAVITIGLPFLTILATSFKMDVGKSLLAPGNFTLNQWNALAREETLGCLRNSLIFGTLSASIGIVIACTMSYLLHRTTLFGRGLPNFLITLGSGTPSVVIALGLIMTMRGKFGVDIYNTASILIIAYLIKYLMMGMQTVSSAMSQIHVSLEECSQISGAGWLKTMLRITVPLILPSIAAGWFLIFIPCFYELSMTTLLYSTNTKTIGFQLYQYWTFTSQPQACAMAFGILAFVIVLNFIMNRLTKGEFSI